MDGDSLSQRTAQLDKAEREHLEDIVTEMRERVEDNVEYQISQQGLDTEPDESGSLDEDTQQLVEAIELEAVDGHTWQEAFEEYITGVGYTIVNRLAALRCMEVRDFINEEVTVFKDNGLTPAAETLVHEEFLMEDEAIVEAYHNACDELAEEIEILFDRSTSYSLVDPDDDTFEELCGMLDEIPDEVWRADDVLGWVYEYYNANQLSAVRERMRTGQFDAEDVAVANQFYTPHWVARMLTDNAVGKAHLQATGENDTCIERQLELSAAQRSERDSRYDSSPSISELCTYLVPSTAESSIPTQHPSELQILDPTCGSGHFLLYAFDVLERIWRDSTDIPRGEIPSKILEYNLYGIDIDMRACQLAAFNLYLKARRRAEIEGTDTFEMPSVGIVCADNHISDTSKAQEVIKTLAESNNDFADALETILKDFQDNKGLGSLLNVKGTLESETSNDQTELTDWVAEIPSLSDWINRLHEEVEQEESNRFLYQNLQSFLRIVLFLTKEYDAVLMNPPYGGHRRMPKHVKEYVQDHYQFKPEYYINFLEQSERLLKPNGRIGMLVPRSFMYKESFENVRRELIESNGDFDFDFLVEFGKGILDNATVRTVGTVLTKHQNQQEVGEFIQLSDIKPINKKEAFARILSGEQDYKWRHHTVQIEEFQKIPGGMLTYWTPSSLRDLYTNDIVFDAEQADLARESVGSAKKGIDTGKNSRFVRKSWECDQDQDDSPWRPYAKGGKRSWFHYPDKLRVLWGEHGAEITRYKSSTIRNREFQGRAAVTWPLIKDSGHRFAHFDSGGVSDNGGPCFYPDSESITYLTALLNSKVYTGLMLAQTPERQWNLSDIAILPYFEIEGKMKSQLEDASSRLFDLVSRFESFHLGSGRYPNTLDEYTDLNNFVTKRRREIEKLLDEMQQQKSDIDTIVAQQLGINDEILDQIEQEAELRYGDYEPIPYGPEKIDTSDTAFCQRLLSHFVVATVRQSDNGIINLSAEFDQGSELHDKILFRIDDLFEAPAREILAEIDRTIGNRSAESKPYPNVEHWIKESFFESHLSYFENTPIIWKLTTSRLVSDPMEEGFRCLVDYGAVDASLFDRLETRYLEPRKAELRERRNSADRRRSDESLTATERASATETYEQCKSGLQQIEQFQEAVQDLAKVKPRDWSREDRELADDLRQDVEDLHSLTENKLQCYDQLLEINDEMWFEDKFSSSFLDTLRTNNDEWLNALKELEDAAKTYTKDADESAEAHLYDLFLYFGGDLKGTVWPTSTGLLSIGYYPKKQADDLLNENGQPRESLANEEATLLARIASGFDQYESLADEVESKCDSLAAKISDEWSDRALSEITTAGYQPNHKHGVKINITPLAEAEIVPTTVDDKVL